RLDPRSSAYTIAQAARVAEPLDVERLRLAFQRLLDRHAILRTRYPERDGAPVQVVDERAPVAVALREARGADESALRELVAAAAAEPFDLERGPVLRVTVFRRAPDDHVVLLTVHHVACDFWSLALLLDELGRLY